MTWLGTASEDKHICGYNNKLFSSLNEIFSNFVLACAEMREVNYINVALQLKVMKCVKIYNGYIVY